MSYEQAAVTVTSSSGNFRWDFSTGDIRYHVFEDSPPFADFRIYAKAFEPLVESDLPYWADITTYAMNVARCGNIRGIERCMNLANIYDFEWTPKNDDELGQGILWSSDGEPNYMGDDTYEDWEFEFEFECNTDNPSPLPTFYGDPTQNEFKVIAKFSNERGCPAKVSQAATPTPGPFTPACRATFRKADQADFGISLSFRNLNNGRFGHGQTLFLPGGPYFFLLSPCERMLACPWGATCNTKEPTSAWLCSFNNNVQSEALTNCTAYGVIPTPGPVYALQVANEVLSGVYFNLTAQLGHNTRVHVNCDDLMPEGHIGFDPWLTMLPADRSLLHLFIRTRDACARFIPTPAPLRDKCDLELWDDARNWELDLNLSKYTDKAKPYNVTVQVATEFGVGGPPYDLLYLPCDGMQCPAGHDCNGDEDAFIWLCEKYEPFHKPTCQAYGLHMYNITMRPVGDYMFAGVNVYYTGHHHKSAHVQYECDNALSVSTLTINPRIQIEENQLVFSTKARLACPVGRGPTPTPHPRHIPNKPVKPAVTPVPIRSPNPHHVVTNDTHVAIVDWQSIQGPIPSRAVQEIEYPQADGHTYYGESHTQWHSWTPTVCPPSYKCPASNFSNFWVCWFDENFQSYCHPVAYKYVPGSRVTQAHPDHLDSGFFLRYEGVWRTHLLLNVSCVPWGAPNTIPFAESIGVYHYDPATQEARWSFATGASYVCPHRLEVAHIPTAPRAAIPKAAVPQQSGIGDFINGSHIGINLKKFGALPPGRSVVGYDTHYHHAEWHMSPWDLIGCPKGKSCGTYQTESANVWKCVGANFESCFPLGDKRYGLTVSFLNASNELAGINAAYASVGGAGGFSVEVHWQCNDSVEYGTVYYNHIVRENETHHIVLWAHTHEVCPGAEWGQVRPGAVFLLIVSVVFFAYFVLGTLVKYVLTGSVSFLNEGFWSEVADSLTEGALFLVTCGKGQSGGGGSVGGGGGSSYNDI